MSTELLFEGGCLCGAVRYRAIRRSRSRRDLPLLDVPKALGSAGAGIRSFPDRIVSLGQWRAEAIPIIPACGARLLYQVRKHTVDARRSPERSSAGYRRKPR